MPYVNVPNDLSKIKTKMAFNLTKRQLICFGGAAAIGIPSYLLAREPLGNTGAMFLMLAVMLPAFLLAMYEKDGLPFEKVVHNIIRAKFLRPKVRHYLRPVYRAGRCEKGGCDCERQKAKTVPEGVTAGRLCPSSRLFLTWRCTWTGCASSRAGSIQRLWNMRTSIIPWQAPRIRRPFSAAGARSSTTLTALCRSSFLLSTAAPIPGAATR